ncbi:putative RNA uridine N3 methyltransferase [Halorientalis salina]|uniref:putative RNA uridine N3 methyltransferase n=1 Tax=Halorientalis salina TaxID=2932266 RepID=UPI0010ABE6AA|nr:RNA methyltransferase [Halorientalis salina]
MTVSVLVPSSLTREAEDKREATRKLGYVARAATVFRVDRLVVFPDRGAEGRWGGGFVETVLRYAATPPYLRKEAWGKRDELEYVGVMPPLHTAPRTGSGSDESGSLRQGIVTEVGSEARVRVNCGLQHPVSLPVPDGMDVGEGERVTIRVSSRRPVRAKLVDKSPPGYDVIASDLSTELSRDDAGVTVATSRHGEALSVDRLGDIVAETGTRGMTVAFGSPERGLPEMLGFDPADVPSGGSEEVVADEAAYSDEPDGSRFDLWLDAVPNQGSEVVRTEEAMFAVLACLSLTE